MILQYAEHLAAPVPTALKSAVSVPTVLRPVVSVLKGHCLTHAGLSVNYFKGRAVGTFERSAAAMPCCTT